MSRWQHLFLAVYMTLGLAGVLASRDGSPPSVMLDTAIVIGKVNGAVVEYLGIPFAQPPYVAAQFTFVPLAHSHDFGQSRRSSPPSTTTVATLQWHCECDGIRKPVYTADVPKTDTAKWRSRGGRRVLLVIRRSRTGTRK